MDSELSQMLLIALLGAAAGTLVNRLIYLLSSAGTRERIRKYKDDKKYYKKELDKVNVKLKHLDQKMIEQNKELVDVQTVLWRVLNGKLIYTLENGSKSRMIMRNLLLAFDYMIHYNLLEIKDWDSRKSEGSGVDKDAWKALKKSKFFTDSEEGYVINEEAKEIYNYYKKYRDNHPVIN